MSTIGSGLNVTPNEERRAIHDNWIWFLIQGVILAALGLLAIGAPLLASVVVTKLAGWLLLAGGIVGIVTLFTGRKVPGSIWTFLGAVLAIIAGLFLLWRPGVGMLSLTLALAAYFIAQGITQIFTAFAHRHALNSWGWVLASGIVDLILAAIIMYGWPGTAAWVIGLLVGVNLFMYGLALIMTAIASRSVSTGPADAFVPR
jgi:uncharacterized membrane protein HdeD (DUF308 family)